MQNALKPRAWRLFAYQQAGCLNDSRRTLPRNAYSNMPCIRTRTVIGSYVPFANNHGLKI